MKKDNELSVQTKVIIWVTIVIAIISIVYCGYLLYNVLSKKEAKEPTKPVVEVKNPLDKIEDFYGYQELKDLFAFKATEKEVQACYEVDADKVPLTDEEQGNLEDLETLTFCLENGDMILKNGQNIIKKLTGVKNVKSVLYQYKDWDRIFYYFLTTTGELYGFDAYCAFSWSDFPTQELVLISSGIEKITMFETWSDGPETYVLAYKNGKPYKVTPNADEDAEIDADACFNPWGVFKFDIDSAVFEDKRDGIATGFDYPLILLNRELASYGIDFDYPRILDDNQEIIKVKTAFSNINADSMGEESGEKYERHTTYDLYDQVYTTYIITQNQELYKFVSNSTNEGVEKVSSKKIASYKFIGNGGKIVQFGATTEELENALVIKETGSMEITYTDGTTETITGINFRI